MNVNFIKRYILLVGIFWSLLCFAALLSHFRDDYQQAITSAQIRGRTMLERDVLYRNWSSSHGGVYVPVTSSSLPNPYLDFLPERDIETRDGRQLTLINPSYMTRLVFEQDNQFSETISKITSLKYLNPDNAPDSWERKALLQFDKGSEFVSNVVEIEGRSFVRIIRFLNVEPSCLKCHANQGYKLGEVRGGLSISIPFESFWTRSWQHNIVSIGLFCLLWFAGMVIVLLLGRKLQAQTRNVIESEHLRDHAEMSLDFLSYHDRRTNLPNRFKFEKHLHELFPLVETPDDLVVVTILELRNFKQIIDNFDHPVSDTLFKLMAERLVVLLSPEDSVAMFGEDRLLFSYTCKDGKPFDENLMQQICNAASKPLILEDHEFFPVICMGFALYPNDAKDAKSLVHKAVSALTYCLENKHCCVKLYSQSLQDEAKSRLKIEGGLRRALADNGFELFLQPQVDAASGALIGAEALLRWPSEDSGYVSPSEFIPVAEENGLILPIGEWVLQTACIHAIKLREVLGRTIPVGVNVSAKQFQDPAFVDIIDEVLAIDGMVPEMLEIEITEGTFIEDIDQTLEILTDLKVRGLQIAIDDFGTGYSSLGYLSRFPVDRLKIDRSFITDIANNADDRVLVGLITEMGRKLGLNVIAEGVEDDVQKHLLIGMGCHAIQGFLFSRPLSFEAFCTWAKDHPGN